MKLGNIELYNYDNYDNWEKWYYKNEHRKLTGSKGKKLFVRQEFLENMQKGHYFWTSEKKGSSSAWSVNFNFGNDNCVEHSFTYYAVCVR